MGSLYDADILLWSEQQADLLRRLSRGERVNDAVDWENVIEEVGDVGRSEFNSVASLLEVGLTHLLLAHASPRSEPVGHWRSEARTALAGAARRYSPSMGPRLDLQEIWSLAVTTTLDKLSADGGPARPMPTACPFAVQDLVRGAFPTWTRSSSACPLPLLNAAPAPPRPSAAAPAPPSPAIGKTASCRGRRG